MMTTRSSVWIVVLLGSSFLVANSSAWIHVAPSLTNNKPRACSTTSLASTTKDKPSTTATTTASDTTPNVQETTEKYGLEAGLFQSLRQGDGGESAKSLLKRYGIAYLATSIPLAILSFALCYVLVDNGVDVAGLLQNVGIETTGVTETAGTVALAYAAHKAASPIRFPPTVILTPVVAKWIGKEPNESVEEDEE